MKKENIKKALESMSDIYDKIGKQLKLLKKMEISLKASLVKPDDEKYVYVPDHTKNFNYVNDDVIVGVKKVKTGEIFLFDEPVFNVNSISISDPHPVVQKIYTGLVVKQSIAGKYIQNKQKKIKDE